MATAPNTSGRIASASTVNRHIRRALNRYANQIAEKALAKALAGDTTAMLAVSNLLLAANAQSNAKE